MNQKEEKQLDIGIFDGTSLHSDLVFSLPILRARFLTPDEVKELPTGFPIMTITGEILIIDQANLPRLDCRFGYTAYFIPTRGAATGEGEDDIQDVTSFMLKTKDPGEVANIVENYLGLAQLFEGASDKLTIAQP